MPQSPQIHLSITPESQAVRPGQQTAFVVAVENTSREAQAQSMELSGLPDAWYKIDFDTRNRAFPGERRVANIVISAPENANGGTYEFTVAVLAGAAESSIKASVEVPSAAPMVAAEPAPPTAVEATAEEPTPAPFVADAREITDEPETAVEPVQPAAASIREPVYVAPAVTLEGGLIIWRGQGQAAERKLLTIRNPGEDETDYVLTVEGLEPNWYSLLSSARVAPGHELRTDLTVHPPEGARKQDYPFRVVVRVDGQPALRAEASGWLSLPATGSSAPTTTSAAPATPAPPAAEPPPTPATPQAERVSPPDVLLSPRSNFHFGPGEAVAQALLTVTNRSRVRERYRIVLSGIPADWYRLSDEQVRLDPGEHAQISLRLSPVTGPGLPAGEYEFLARAIPDGMPDHYGEALGILSITGVAKFDARLEPLQAEGRSKPFMMRVMNTGDLPLRISLEPSDAEGKCTFKVPPPRPLEPGQEGFVQLKVGAKRNSFVGPRETFDFRVHVVNEDGEAQSARDRFDGRFVHRPLISWRVVFLTGFMSGLVGFVLLLVWLASPLFEDAANWVGCQLDDDYRLSADHAPYEKEVCGGRPRDVELDEWQQSQQTSLIPMPATDAPRSIYTPAAKLEFATPPRERSG